MSKVLTINNWWDGPLEGLAYYNDDVCIFERIFDEAKDDWSDEYYLTPINAEEQRIIMDNWKEWCVAVVSNDIYNYYSTHFHIQYTTLVNSSLERKYRKRAVFRGSLDRGFIPIDYNVEWSD